MQPGFFVGARLIEEVRLCADHVPCAPRLVLRLLLDAKEVRIDAGVFGDRKPVGHRANVVPVVASRIAVQRRIRGVFLY